jgi:hypothetical protein
MKTFRRTFVCACVACCLGATALRADVPAPGGPAMLLDSWSFYTNTWLSDLGYSPIRFTNLVNVAGGGDGKALLLDTSNATPAYLEFNTTESDGTNEFSLPAGTFSWWFKPNWAGTNHGGTGPGAAGRFFELGNYTTNASVGWLSLYVSADGTMVYFAGQTNNGSQNTFLSSPVDFYSNTWCYLALTYSSTNTAFYTNGVLATNGSGMTYYPPPGVVANGFSIGSSVSNIVSQARGVFDDVETFNWQLDPGTINGNFDMYGFIYYGDELPDFFRSAPSTPSTNSTSEFNAITGTGYLVPVSTNTTCIYGTNLYDVWFTNTVPSIVLSNTNFITNLTFTAIIAVTNAGNVTTNLMFAIGGGASGVPYDIFANSSLGFGPSYTWAWLGQGYTCVTYGINMTNFSNAPACLLVLGTPRDSDGDGLTDAYEDLVSHTSTNNVYSLGDGIPDAWKVLHGLNPTTAGLASQDLDHDGLTNLQEYLYGTDPWVSEGMAVWAGVQEGS